MRVFAFAIGLLAAAPAAWGTSFFEAPFPDAVKDAPVIVRGTAGPGEADWGHERDGAKRIFTYYDLKVAEVFKGLAEPSGSILRMREMGGEKDGIGMQVSGTASFAPGEDVVVFLGDKNGEGSYDVWGMMMGRFSVTKADDGQEVLRGAGISTRASGASPVPRWTLDALRRLVASQGSAPASGGEAVVSPRPLPHASEPPVQAAPQLQSQAPVAPPDAGSVSSGSSSGSFNEGWVFVGAFAVLAGVGFFLARRR